MKSIRILSLALALSLAGIHLSCSQDATRQQNGEQNQTVDDLYTAVRIVEKNLSQGFLLRSDDPRGRLSFENILYDIKIATMRLKKDARDTKALSLLYMASQEYDKLSILAQDESQLDALKQKLRETLDVISRIQGKRLENIERVLIAKQFDSELAPFTTITAENKSGWAKKNHLELHYALASGSKLNSWLFTPMLDLTQVVNPSFNLEQAISNRGNPFADSVFFLVSEDYTGGDPALATWDTISVERLPDGGGFSMVKSEDVSLKRYEGKRIVIAFHYDSRNAASYPIWQVSSFNLLGSGTLASQALTLTDAGAGVPTALSPAPNVVPVTSPVGAPSPTMENPPPLVATAPPVAERCTANAAAKNIFSFQFSKADVAGDFTKIDTDLMILVPKAPDYTQIVRFSGYRKGAANAVGSSWLVSRTIDLSSVKDVCLSIADDTYFPSGTINLDQVAIVVSSDYTNDVATATWKKVEFSGRKAQIGTVKKELLAAKANAIQLKDVLGAGAGKVTVALHYTSSLASAPWWAVWDVTMTAIPAE